MCVRVWERKKHKPLEIILLSWNSDFINDDDDDDDDRYIMATFVHMVG